MTPKEKALELKEKYYVFAGPEYAIKMALICVDEILKAAPLYPNDGTIRTDCTEHIIQAGLYWKQVKDEL